MSLLLPLISCLLLLTGPSQCALGKPTASPVEGECGKPLDAMPVLESAAKQQCWLRAVIPTSQLSARAAAELPNKRSSAWKRPSSWQEVRQLVAAHPHEPLYIQLSGRVGVDQPPKDPVSSMQRVVSPGPLAAAAHAVSTKPSTY